MKDAVARMADVPLIQGARHAQDAFESLGLRLVKAVDAREAVQLASTASRRRHDDWPPRPRRSDVTALGRHEAAI